MNCYLCLFHLNDQGLAHMLVIHTHLVVMLRPCIQVIVLTHMLSILFRGHSTFICGVVYMPIGGHILATF